MNDKKPAKSLLLSFALVVCCSTRASCAYGGVPKYSEELRDHCWLWGHETGPVDGTNNGWLLDVARSSYHMADAARKTYYDQTFATADPDNAPTIANPDTTPTFRGSVPDVRPFTKEECFRVVTDQLTMFR